MLTARNDISKNTAVFFITKAPLEIENQYDVAGQREHFDTEARDPTPVSLRLSSRRRLIRSS
jgi:hypothetical protein